MIYRACKFSPLLNLGSECYFGNGFFFRTLPRHSKILMELLGPMTNLTRYIGKVFFWFVCQQNLKELVSKEFCESDHFAYKRKAVIHFTLQQQATGKKTLLNQ